MNAAHVCLALALGLAGTRPSEAQDLDVQGNDARNTGIIFQARNLRPGAIDKIAIQGQSNAAVARGIGVKGVGGWKGVVGEANYGGGGLRVGVEGGAAGGVTNYGVYAYVPGGTAGTNYGVWAEAPTGNASNRAGKFQGNLEYTSIIAPPSDGRLKKNIRNIRPCLKVIAKLAPKEYDFRTDEFPEMNFDHAHQFGLIAQDVEQVLPELVGTSSAVKTSDEQAVDKDSESRGYAPADKASYRNLNYMGLVPIILGAVKEQQAQLDALDAKISRLRK